MTGQRAQRAWWAVVGVSTVYCHRWQLHTLGHLASRYFWFGSELMQCESCAAGPFNISHLAHFCFASKCIGS